MLARLSAALVGVALFAGTAAAENGISSAAMYSAERGRWLGLLASARSTIKSNSRGNSGLTRLGESGSVVAIACITASMLGPENGSERVAAS